MYLPNDLARIIVEERQRSLIAEATARREARNRKAAAKAARRSPGLRSRAAPGHLSPRAKSA